MQRYRLTLTPQAPVATPFHSGTLFGHLCWAYRYRHGEAALLEWLETFRERPLLLSDAMPEGYLPRPVVAPPAGERREALAERLGRGDLVEGYKRLKQYKKRRWISERAWEALRDGYDEGALYEHWLREEGSAPPTAAAQVRPHNRIDRQRATTPESGGLYFVETRVYPRGARLTVYVETDALDETELAGLFGDVGHWGYGRDASSGLGRFRVEVRPYEGSLFDHPGSRRLSLSHGAIDGSTPRARYRLHTHYGRLGGTFAQDDTSPFKRPVLLAEPGATFDGAGGLAGALLQGVHGERPEIRHHAFHLTLPFTDATA
ncbi:MAG: hypothetical protein D6739_09880 [Nitrospirae bacterium]|nr:MAG: hypothetical protein D6739_09880 [Nitrospirota bacterium]